jgi:oligoribonuclease NrnB/cAMP/cGMP phosphodiesterase (DHH superfamily)
MTKTVILYHAQCMDGTASRYAAWKKFGDNAEYYPCQYGQPLPNFARDKETEVYFLDYSTSRTELEALGEACGRVVVLDHHVTAREALEGCNHSNVEIVFDMDRSGAVIAWNYFFPDTEAPMLLQYVQDRDLWKFKFGDDSKTIHAGLGTLKGNMPLWNKYASNENALQDLINTGEVLLDRDKASVEAQVPANVKVVEFMGYRCGFLNTGQLVSEMGHAMYSDETLNVDIGVCWFVTKDDTVILSLRSKQGTGPDVSEIAKMFGGGGHKNAAGGRTTLTVVEQILKGMWKSV